MTNAENSGKQMVSAGGNAGFLTYSALTDKPAKFLRVADPFRENGPAQFCGFSDPVENKCDPRPACKRDEGLTSERMEVRRG